VTYPEIYQDSLEVVAIGKLTVFRTRRNHPGDRMLTPAGAKEKAASRAVAWLCRKAETANVAIERVGLLHIAHMPGVRNDREL
jgi:hypothetical protein